MQKLLPFIIFSAILFCICLVVTFITIPAPAARIYGQPASWLTISQRVQYSASLPWYDGLLTNPRDVNGAEQSFSVQQSESVNSIPTESWKTKLLQPAARTAGWDAV